MPFSTGTARTPTDLLNKINTHLVANGWTKLFGNTNMGTDSPQSARYWRIVWGETQRTSDTQRQLSGLEFRTTVGGANVATTAGNLTSNQEEDSLDTWGDVLGGGATRRTIPISDAQFTLTYDFGVATTIREVTLTCPLDDEAPRQPAIQFSDDGLTWNTMYMPASPLSWTSGETKTFTFNDTYRDPLHPATNSPRRKGHTGLSTSQDNTANQLCDGHWAWQGAGYDATRRVYIQAYPYSSEDENSHWIGWQASVDWDGDLPPHNQNGQNPDLVFHLMDANEIEYWIYSNSLRIILVTKSGVGDYCSSYIGFMAAFGQPADYSFPLFVGSTSGDLTQQSITSSGLSMFCDPGNQSAFYRDWEGAWKEVQNRDYTIAAEDDYDTTPVNWVYPWHHGDIGASEDWPFQPMGTNGTNGNHWLDHVVAGPNDELPLITATVIDYDYGVVGALDGCFAFPGANVVAPEQIVTISLQDYKLFPNRDRRQGHHWMAIRED